jgi:DNA-binding transcriptional regulator GbsR (MarR family)
MELEQAKNKFIETWGTAGGEWGINRTMAQIHALLLISPEPISAQDIMESLGVSSGNVNMNVRDLISWGIVSKVIVKGERKEYFAADRDIHKVAMKIMNERKKRELLPLLETLEGLSKVNVKSAEGKSFTKTVNDINTFGKNAHKLLERLSKANENWFTGPLIKFITK